MLRRARLVVPILGLAVASACTVTSAGEPHPESETGSPSSNSAPPTSSSEGELPFAGTPKVNDPLDTSIYEQDPCKSLTAAQTQSLNLPSSGTVNNDVALGIGCNWSNPDTRGEVKINFIVDDPRGLSPEYKANEDGKWKYFEEVPDIEGHPAVIRGAIDDRDLGYCTLIVGTADDMAFATIVQLPLADGGTDDPCKAAAEVAGLALQTMKKGA
jgi:hypothetical protein